MSAVTYYLNISLVLPVTSNICLLATNCYRTDHDQESVLEDKESIRDLKALYDAYGSMDVSSMYDPQMYDDEYDDTYDINNVGADDADSADELTQIRFVFAVFPSVLLL